MKTSAKWQNLEIKKILNTIRCREKVGNLRVTFYADLSFPERDLDEPLLMLSEVREQVIGEMDKKAEEIKRLLSCKTKQKWLDERTSRS